VGIFLLLPIRSCLNRCCKGEAAEAPQLYDQIFHTFPTDYDRENPVTKKDGMRRMMEKKISMASGEERQRLMMMMQGYNSYSMLDNFGSYSNSH
jgi:hypothetical protein